MKEFPTKMNVKEKDNFDKYLYDRYLCYLRKDIYEHLLLRNNNENNYFDLDKWVKNNLNNDISILNKMLIQIIDEIKDLGWKCQTTFGGTALFIYSTDIKPHLCYDDEL
jgi:hypothetical protein